TMSHMDKMKEAAKIAYEEGWITEDAWNELGGATGVAMMVGSMIVVAPALGALAATGPIGAGAALVIGGAMVADFGYQGVKQLVSGVPSLLSFLDKTRCDKAQTPDDLKAAGKDFADAVGKIGVGMLNTTLAILGGRKVAKGVAEFGKGGFRMRGRFADP